MTIRTRPLPCVREMVEAIHAGRKTNTRRVMRPQPVEDPRGYLVVTDRRGLAAGASPGACWWFGCPYGNIGDRLWVREALVRSPNGTVQYAYDGAPVRVDGVPARWGWQHMVLPSRFMPKYAARTWLDLTEVRVERIQAISEADAQAEGVQLPARSDASYRAAFMPLWDRLNADRGYGWDANPWVWVLVFTRLEPAAESQTTT